ncbi:hypothetical protein M222_0727 [Enterococcus faecalis AZ19]|nr:hypothetical protein M222_0727 [Enterococcus faecalis AZ19]
MQGVSFILIYWYNKGINRLMEVSFIMGEKLDAIKEFLFESCLETSIEVGKEVAKEEIPKLALTQGAEVGANIMLEASGTMIPAIGPAIANYRQSKKIANINKLMEELNKQQQVLSENFSKQTNENKEILDTIFEYIVERTEFTKQDEKIEYMINGYSELLKMENPSFDVAYLYINTLDQLTLLDIATLKLSYDLAYTFYDTEEPRSYEEILEEFDIDEAQYAAVRQNLFRMGLLENDYDNKIVKDWKSMVNAIDDIRKTTATLVSFAEGKNTKIKRLSSHSNVKTRARDKLMISKFGKDFIRYFLKKESLQNE